MNLLLLILFALPSLLYSTFALRDLGLSINYTIANFGLIPYGKKITGQIRVANPMTNCEVEDDIAEDN